MPKLKTKKAAAKRVKVTGTGKVTRRITGHNHYNRKDTGREGMAKGGDVQLFKADEKNMLRALPSKSSRR
ncbi:MAG: 50S ribosomal protein L35 [Parcubacteria group bacterium]|jgi:large subunit ribosomal protein L35